MKRFLLTFALAFAAAPQTHGQSAAGPQWVDSAEGFTFPFHAAPGESVVSAEVRYPGDDFIPIESDPVEMLEGVIGIAVPPARNPRAGLATLRLMLSTGESIENELPVSYRVEIDITGPAAESILTPLPDDDYLVDYVPCCNIYGGLLIAERIPINPVESEAGLPKGLLSDFVMLEPDGLTASTMGLHFEFGYESGLPAERIGLYEWGINEWREVFEYEVDAEKKRIRFHCPDGGTFVAAEKPERVADDNAN